MLVKTRIKYTKIKPKIYRSNPLLGELGLYTIILDYSKYKAKIIDHKKKIILEKDTKNMVNLKRELKKYCKNELGVRFFDEIRRRKK